MLVTACTTNIVLVYGSYIPPGEAHRSLVVSMPLTLVG
jgi:hypothetical protein